MLDKQNTGLLVIDIQGNLATIVNNSEAFIASSLALIKGAKALDLPIVCAQQLPEKLGATLPEIAKALYPVTPINKHTFSGAACTELVQAIKKANVDTWLICGIEAHICVYQTASDLLDMNLNVHLVVDCVSSRAPFNKDLAIKVLQSKGASLTSVEMCLYELVEDSLASEFKEILKLIK